MALIPQDMRETHNDRDRRRNRSPSPRRSRRSPSPRRSRSRERYRDGGRRERDSGYDRNRRSGRGDSRERGRDRDRDDHRAPEPRRASPEYDDYKRPPPPSGGDARATWKPQDVYAIRPYYQGSGADFLEDRRIQRENRVVNPWPPSPKEPARELSPKRSKKSSRKSKRQRSSSPSSSDDSEEERRRRERKERKRARRKEKDERRDKKRSRRHEEDDGDDGHRHRSKSRSKSALPVSLSPSASPSRSASPARMDVDKHAHSSMKESRHSSKAGDDDSGDEVGPKPIVVKNTTKKIDERAYGGALLRGEGSAMAAFLQDGTETRIPRRGEIGLTSDEIAQFEDVGYVMSGSRHRRMNAVRMRKENQVISAEEKRGILKLQKEEKARREAILREEFSELVNERLKASSSQAPPK
ncbi:hypothetical protein NLJ89_g2682 [Agrocybe chaxingu]|uniref:NF-kappa-B-activating protein C-terminal domain-containing protein n=1 Tax=Agrocybe chaxingu TaxID=84603 RepID=A0A9W8KAV7_9AGAR|nr:hypothetical protein NLJ89_g2682 [Agrocybe chaxingu]